ncbi:deoxyribonuclease IV [Paenibacillus radicis (ex Xue et al. 2023)]|uniref:Deoxyribonuclease IV n=1 Tax=Paenibacillus radicis (ex Xue et al. 2023) TaxID=2972489 RepID=A0ABT1YHI2_9BACL|nr:deoxyribonuclease IV [Paenibacillus radicis (ex Xue et al. 2023)]MCR8631874.1 deoxyribonuclease IV [Paenibacillus radicis (ex Xue et al. 2023)]
MKIGCHISIRKGYEEAAKTAIKLQAGAFQYFSKNPRSLIIKRWNAKDAEACFSLCREQGVLSIAHSPYPTNLASEDSELRHATVMSLRNDLEIAEACGSVGVVVHFGKYKGGDTLQGYKNIIQCLHEVLSDWQGQAKLLIENQAGEGTRMGTSLEELMQIRNLSDCREHIGFCFDTCHAYASGLWPSHPNGWGELAAKASSLGYFDHLKAIHINDSLYPGGMGKDRHENIGKGYIGELRFREFLQSPSLRALPLVLETPTPANGSHASEIEFILELSRIKDVQ